ncbi:hypothetical protein Pcinc_023788 [Petrolisthes cinctipes]|uniref:Uncharacterized protein n=1 Tax=Petrolisthes cinctipes TaxID=88211 RepID=A0AAE1ETT5_PETCI|nr:hypothetical protein Pcinc_044493 [Petrolisthes cinctipes]KAK3871041.1 hypothetical protein Pcinc_023788 [Petrolisthes cinctipes]
MGDSGGGWWWWWQNDGSTSSSNRVVVVSGQGVVWSMMVLLLLLLCLPMTSTQVYQIVTVQGEKGVCNDTVWVDGAAILRLTDQPSYSYTPFTCFITFKAPQHTWSGLTGVLEEVDLRKYCDKAEHHMAQNQCVDYFKVVTDTGAPPGEQCGYWNVGHGQPLSQMGYRRALVGYCPTPPDNVAANDMQCGLSVLTVQVSVGMKDNSVWRYERWKPHKGFTFVVTSYSYQMRERECAANMRSCSEGHGDPPYCVLQSLWCDNHINCGHPTHNLDESTCLRQSNDMLDSMMAVLAGPWVLVVVLLLVVVVGAAYWKRTRLPIPAHHPVTASSNGHHTAQEMNSYAESYEVSSTLSTAPHMAIQVRVVCSPGQMNSANNHHHHHNYQVWPGSTTTTTTTIDLPPAYDSLFPDGPPPPPPPYPPSSSSCHSLNSTHSNPNINATSTTSNSITPTTTVPTTATSTPIATTTITTTSQLSLAVNNHNAASLSTTIVASGDQMNAEATTSTTIGVGTGSVPKAGNATATNMPPTTTTTTTTDTTATSVPLTTKSTTTNVTATSISPTAATTATATPCLASTSQSKSLPDTTTTTNDINKPSSSSSLVQSRSEQEQEVAGVGMVMRETESGSLYHPDFSPHQPLLTSTQASHRSHQQQPPMSPTLQPPPYDSVPRWIQPKPHSSHPPPKPP